LNYEKSPIRKLNNKFRVDLDKRSITPILTHESNNEFYSSMERNNNLTA